MNTNINYQLLAEYSLYPDQKTVKENSSLIIDAFHMEQEELKETGSTGYMARALAQATLPHTDPQLAPGTLYSRETGLLTLTIAPTSKQYGIPFGTIPRMILTWICAEIVYNKHSKNRLLKLGNSQDEFMKKIRMHRNGRDITRFREQAMRLFRSVISVEYSDENYCEQSDRLLISNSDNILWHPRLTEQKSLWQSTLEVSEKFQNMVLDAPVPIDMNVINSLSKSPMAMDIYVWLTYRMFVLSRSRKPSAYIPWVGLQAQFGAGFQNTNAGLANFKSRFKIRLKEVLHYYSEAKNHVSEAKNHLILTPAKPHVSITRNKKS